MTASPRLTEVRVRVPCEDCENGVVQNPTWANYFADEAHVNETELLRSKGEFERAADLDVEWFRAHGYAHDRWPPEEEPCFECSGTTWIEKWVSVRDLSHELWLEEALEAARL